MPFVLFVGHVERDSTRQVRKFRFQHFLRARDNHIAAFSAGDTFVVGGTWGTNATKLYVKGTLAYTRAGNFAVEYWRPEWQRLIFGTPDSYLDRIMAQGYAECMSPPIMGFGFLTLAAMLAAVGRRRLDAKREA